MDQPSESPLTPLGLQLQDASDLPAKNLDYPITDVCGWTFLLWLVGPFCVSNLLFVPCVLWIDYTVGPLATGIRCCLAASMGIIPLQMVVLSYYAVFSSEVWWLRLAIFTGVIALCAAAGLVGMSAMVLMTNWHIHENDVQNVLQFVCVVPLIAFATQLPFWPLRVYFGWQFMPTNPRLGEMTIPTDRPAQFSIQQMMAATAVVAVVLGLMRMAPLAGSEESDFWFGCAAMSAAGAACSLLAGIPLILCFTRLRWWFALGLAVGVPTVIFWGGVAYLTTWIKKPVALRDMIFDACMSTIIGLTFVLGFAASVYLLRLHSWTIGRPTRSVESRSGSNG